MDHIGVVGLSYRHASVEEVARFAIPKGDMEARLLQLRDALAGSEIVFLATCNRVEVIFATHDDSAAQDLRAAVFRALRGRDPGLGEAAEALRAWTGEAAVEHVFLLACGLNSAQAGEHEITAQMRNAWDVARSAGVCGPTLNRLMSESLSMANRVRRLSAARPPSLADLAVKRLLAHCDGGAGPIALVGVSPMTRRCGQCLHEAGLALVIVNRSTESAEEWARSLGARCMSLIEFRSSPPDVAALVLAAGASETILDERALRALAQAAATPPIIIDFGLPPNVEPAAARAAGLRRLGMDELIEATGEQRLSELMRLAPVRAAIDERLARLRGELATRAIGARLAELRDSFEGIAATQMDELLAQNLRDLDEGERKLLRRFAKSLARRLAHLPLAGIRAAAAHANSDTVDAFFSAARLQRVPRTDDVNGKQNS